MKIPPPSPAPEAAFGLIAWLQQTRIALPLKLVEVRFRVDGPLAHVEIDQVYRQTHSEPLDCRYTFPLPDEETLAMLDIPPFAETVKQRKQGSFWDIFKSDRPKTETKTETKKESEKPAHPANPPKEEKSNIWQKIKDALKKK